jgi:hypothetical protein
MKSITRKGRKGSTQRAQRKITIEQTNKEQTKLE